MKLTKGKKAAMICFAAFLGFMAVCTVTAKGIYASGLPRVTTVKPYSGSLTHVIEVSGTVVQGQEYGIYVEPGLRVDTVCVEVGNFFQAGDVLFGIDTADLEDLIAERRLETAKLEAQMAEGVKEDNKTRQERKRTAERAREDYDREAALADAEIEECRQAYDAAQRALVLYNQYLEEASRSGETGTGENTGQAESDGGAESSGSAPDGTGEAEGELTPDGNGTGSSEVHGETDANDSSGGDNEEAEAYGDSNAGNDNAGDSASVEEGPDSSQETGITPGGLHEVGGTVADPEEKYNQEEKRRQLEQNVITAAQAVEEAERRKEDRLQDAARALEDAEAAIEAANSAIDTMALDIEYQKERVQKLEALLEADGWVYAEVPGRVTENRLRVGERTQDRAEILYARDDGERIINAVFSEEQAGHIPAGTQFEVKAYMADGSRTGGTAVLDYLEKTAEDEFRARLSFEMQDISTGQSVELTYRMQTENYSACVPVNCIFQENGLDYIYVAEEQQGILGTEWRLRKVNVRTLDKNDTVAAIQSAEITGDARIVSGANKPLTDGAVVRVL